MADHIKTIPLRPAGSATVAIRADLFELDDHDRAFVLEVVDLVRARRRAAAAALPVPDGGAADGE